MIKIILCLIALMAITTIPTDCVSQDNKFKKSFASADIAFSVQLNRILSDSILIVIEGSKEKELLLIYWSGYIDGSLSAIEKKSFDFKTLKANIIANRKSIESYTRFLQLYSK